MEATAFAVKDEALKFGAGAAVMTVAQEMLFNELVVQYWEDEKAAVEVHFDNLLFMAQTVAVMKGLM